MAGEKEWNLTLHFLVTKFSWSWNFVFSEVEPAFAELVKIFFNPENLQLIAAHVKEKMKCIMECGSLISEPK